MKTRIAVAAAAITLCSSEGAQAQDQRWGGGIPSGSYQQSCRGARVSGDILTATCQDTRGRWNFSSLRLRSCNADIANQDGRLVCGGPGWGGGGPGWGGGWGGGVPSGTYQGNCRDARVSGGVLTASCVDNRGRWNTSSLRFRECRNDIRNDNGRLACEWGNDGGGVGGGGPGWGGNSTAVLFDAPDFGGQPFQANREVTNLPRQFNDRAMSLRIQGRGAWQVCSDSDFRGRCQIFDRDVPDLRRYGLGEAVSSLRPVSGR